jgi:hypothetical protein
VQSHVVMLIVLKALAFGLLGWVWAHKVNASLRPRNSIARSTTSKPALDEPWSYRQANRADFDAGIAALHRQTGQRLGGAMKRFVNR